VDDITPIVVFNSASWMRTDVITAHASFYGEVTAFYRPGADYGDAFECVQLYDCTGKKVPFQYVEKGAPITREATICFTAHDVPPFGYRLYYLASVAEDAPPEPCCQVSGLDEASKVVVESLRFRLEVERPTGRVSLYDKERDAVIAADMELVAYEDGSEHHSRSGRSFPNTLEKIEVVENGIVRMRLCITGHIGRNRTLQEWILTRDMDYVEVIDHIDWEGHPSRIYTKRVIPIGVETPTVTYGVPFGTNGWDNRLPNSGPHLRDEYPADIVDRTREPLHWIDFGGKEGGVTISTERHTVECEDSALHIALLHAGGSRRPVIVSWGDKHFVTRTRLRSHEKGWAEANSHRDGMALFLPLFAVSEADPLSPKQLEPVAGLCDFAADNVIITTIKKAEAGEGTIVRGYEAQGRETGVTPLLAGGSGHWSEVDLLEANPRPVRGEVVWQPFEIKTLISESPAVDSSKP
jgi:alpha-mannosidase